MHPKIVAPVKKFLLIKKCGTLIWPPVHVINVHLCIIVLRPTSHENYLTFGCLSVLYVESDKAVLMTIYEAEAFLIKRIKLWSAEEQE